MPSPWGAVLNFVVDVDISNFERIYIHLLHNMSDTF